MRHSSNNNVRGMEPFAKKVQAPPELMTPWPPGLDSTQDRFNDIMGIKPRGGESLVECLKALSASIFQDGFYNEPKILQFMKYRDHLESIHPEYKGMFHEDVFELLPPSLSTDSEDTVSFEEALPLPKVSPVVNPAPIRKPFPKYPSPPPPRKIVNRVTQKGRGGKILPSNPRFNKG